MSIRLSERLGKALRFARPSLSSIDVGADHGYLSMALENQGHRVYAVENKIGPFNMLKESLSSENSNVTPIFADGLRRCPEDVRQAFILGMGGRTIARILSDSPKALARLEVLVIEPQSDPEAAIAYLLGRGFENTDGCYVFERHYYPMLRFERTGNTMSYTKAQNRFGPAPLAKRDPVLLEFIEKERRRLEKLVNDGYDKKQELMFYQEVLKDYF